MSCSSLLLEQVERQQGWRQWNSREPKGSSPGADPSSPAIKESVKPEQSRPCWKAQPCHPPSLGSSHTVQLLSVKVHTRLHQVLLAKRPCTHTGEESSIPVSHSGGARRLQGNTNIMPQGQMECPSPSGRTVKGDNTTEAPQDLRHISAPTMGPVEPQKSCHGPSHVPPVLMGCG